DNATPANETISSEYSYLVNDPIISPSVSGNRVTFYYSNSTNPQSVTIKGSWKITEGSNGNYTGIYDAAWAGGAETPMVLDQIKNVWKITITLPYNQTYEYGFMVNNVWTNDPLNNEHATNGNDKFTIQSGNLINVIFTLDMSEQVPFSSVQIAGDKFSPAWSLTANPMVLVDEIKKIYRVSINLYEGTVLQYKFVKDGTSWENNFQTTSGNREITIINQEANKMYVSHKFNIAGDARPAAPINLNSIAQSNSIKLSWSAVSDFDLKGYNVYIKQGNSQNYNKIADKITTTEFTATNLTNGETYYFIVRSIDLANQESNPSNEVSAIPGVNAPPSAPQNVRAIPGNNQVNLYWNANTEADLAGYNVYKSLTSGSNYTKVNTTVITTPYYTVLNLQNGIRYYFRVTAIDIYDSESAYSAEVDTIPANVDLTPPLPPRNLTATADIGKIILNWTANTEDDLYVYKIYKSSNGGSYSLLTSVNKTYTSYTDTNVTSGNTYWYKITATDTASPANESGFSNIVYATVPSGSTIEERIIDGDFLDWKKVDVRCLDEAEDNVLKWGDEYDACNDLVAVYSREGQLNYYFRVDLFDLYYMAEENYLDVVIAIDCDNNQNNGTNNLPNFVNGYTNFKWDIAIVLKNTTTADVWTSSWTNYPAMFKGSAFRADLDSIELAIDKSIMLNNGWTQGGTFKMMVYTVRSGSVSDYTTEFYSNSTTGTAKYAAILHANQSLNLSNHVAEWIQRSDSTGYYRAIEAMEKYNVKMNLHISGTLLAAMKWTRPDFITRIKNNIQSGRASIIGGVFAEHIMPYFEGEVNANSIKLNEELLMSIFDLTTKPKVFWIPERVVKGTTFSDILNNGYTATVIDQITHLKYWFGETNVNKLHKINGVFCFLINDDADQKKFWNEDNGLHRETRKLLLNKAIDTDQEQLVLVFDDWEAYAGRSFTSVLPNDNADNWEKTVKWLANHQWIETVLLDEILTKNWNAIDKGTNTGLSIQTYEWLKHASENSYDNWYNGSSLEDSFKNAVPVLTGDRYSSTKTFLPNNKKYGDINTPNTIIYDVWNYIKNSPDNELKKTAELAFQAMIYETAWHDEDNDNYAKNPDGSWKYPDTTFDKISDWA
ncbi:MAG TPA: fibronectin type III domain-containing protein, partial [bacterium]|nr:fibronectin type III domain-containing protein [bacterium]